MTALRLSLLAALAASSPLPAGEKIVTLGDSLTFAYEAEFGFEVTPIPFGPTYGDGFGPEVRNWIEILNAPAYRKEHFDIGGRNDITVDFTFSQRTLFFRHDCNWAIPGLRIRELRRFVSGEVTFLDLLGESGEFETLMLVLALSDFDPDEDFALADLEEQVRTSARRLTLFIGGNDVRGHYGAIYDGEGAGDFVDEFVDDTAFILDWALTLNPNLEIVLANVPHIGITPDVQSRWPTDPVKTGRVTAVMRDLNGRLADLAASRTVGYADVFTPTLLLMEPGPFAIHGIPFQNSGSETGDLNHVWLNGPLSANFHPNTQIHALVANWIIQAFNQRYGTGIAPLTATEILAGLHGRTAPQIDMPFADWMTAFGLAGLPESDDSDGDGIPAGVEFALGLHPRLHDSVQVRTALRTGGNGPAFELRYPRRLPTSSRFTLNPAFSTDLSAPFTPMPAPPAGPDGLHRAVLPLEESRGFLRLESVIAP